MRVLIVFKIKFDGAPEKTVRTVKPLEPLCFKDLIDKPTFDVEIASKESLNFNSHKCT